MKTLKQLLEKKADLPQLSAPVEPTSITSYVPKTKDEKRFMDKHVVKKTDDARANPKIEIAKIQVAFSKTLPVRVTPIICEALPPKAAPAPPFEFWPKITRISKTAKTKITLINRVNIRFDLFF